MNKTIPYFLLIFSAQTLYPCASYYKEVDKKKQKVLPNNPLEKWNKCVCSPSKYLLDPYHMWLVVCVLRHKDKWKTKDVYQPHAITECKCIQETMKVVKLQLCPLKLLVRNLPLFFLNMCHSSLFVCILIGGLSNLAELHSAVSLSIQVIS